MVALSGGTGLASPTTMEDTPGGGPVWRDKPGLVHEDPAVPGFSAVTSVSLRPLWGGDVDSSCWMEMWQLWSHFPYPGCSVTRSCHYFLVQLRV